MRILYLADIRFPLERANGIQTIETCHALARRGHQVTLLVRPDTHRPARDPLAFYDLLAIDALTIARVRVVVRPRCGGRNIWLRRCDVRSGAARCRDVVLTRDLGVASMLLRWPRRRRPPIVYESHGYAPIVSGLLPELLSTATAPSQRPSQRKTRRLARRERRVWRHAEGYVTITAALARDLREQIDPARRACRAGRRARRSGRSFDWIGPDPASPLVAYAGHLYPWKGVDILLDALALAPSLRGRIIGGHAAEPDLRASAGSRAAAWPGGTRRVHRLPAAGGGS